MTQTVAQAPTEEHGSGMMPMLQRPFHTYGLQTRIFLSQLPLTLTIAVVMIPLAITTQSTASDPLFRWGVIVVGVITVLSAAVPWDRLPYGTYLVLPMLDFFAVGLIIHGAAPDLDGLSLLLGFPVLWLAWSSILPRVMCLVSFVLPLLVTYAPFILGREEITARNLGRPLLVPVMTFGLAVAATYVNREMESHQEKVEEAGEISRQRQRLVEAIVDTADVGVLAIDAHGVEILKNPRQHALQARAEPDVDPEDPGEGRLLLFEGPDRTPIPVADRPVRRAARGESFTRDRIWLGKGASERAVNVSAQPMFDDEGDFAGSVLVFEDVTELVAALAAQDDFVSGISHEFRTPLTSIIGYSDLLLESAEDGGMSPADRRSVVVVQRNAERLLGLVNDLLGTASGRVPLVLERVDLTAIVRECAEAAVPSANSAGLTLGVDAEACVHVSGDRVKLTQVLDNLVSNAVKYTAVGGVLVRVGVRGGLAFMEVEDTGPGLTEAEQRQLFDRFYRTESARASTIPGSGLGMAVVKSIVDAHGGELIVDSEPGRGTRMVVRLPLAPDGTSGGINQLPEPAAHA
ncbi:PAS domain-containing sensor histidine kinase [Tessaracoccus sp. OS52]|uniref:sensor histidine kinase n=1 Tax=Tessaracoccus sp. OS52 TaxID=2886691 RepID=UPI001D0F572E|nr:PAS domain-containing sensor histidine kinase [Tessaracoccus sp. OS52]MCC2593730.1 PAS domain-containing sensor histidine kinase [Tessaracoccus sp. OS52]